VSLRWKELKVLTPTPPHHNRFTALFPGPLGWADARRDFMVQGKITEADTPTISLGATPSGLTSAHLHYPPFFTGQMPCLPPNQQCQSTHTKATSTFRLSRRSYSSPQQCYLHRIRTVIPARESHPLSSFLDPTTDCWWKAHCTLCASCRGTSAQIFSIKHFALICLLTRLRVKTDAFYVWRQDKHADEWVDNELEIYIEIMQCCMVNGGLWMNWFRVWYQLIHIISICHHQPGSPVIG